MRLRTSVPAFVLVVASLATWRAVYCRMARVGEGIDVESAPGASGPRFLARANSFTAPRFWGGTRLWTELSIASIDDTSSPRVVRSETIETVDDLPWRVGIIRWERGDRVTFICPIPPLIRAKSDRYFERTLDVPAVPMSR